LKQHQQVIVLVDDLVAKGQVFAETRQVSPRDKCRLTQITLSFAVFVEEEVALALFTAQHFPSAGYFNPL
jgi:hypothetical protein